MSDNVTGLCFCGAVKFEVALNCVDDSGAPTLCAHIWTEDKQPWMTIADALPVYLKDIGS